MSPARSGRSRIALPTAASTDLQSACRCFGTDPRRYLSSGITAGERSPARSAFKSAISPSASALARA
jgi:hypothetical protein